MTASDTTGDRRLGSQQLAVIRVADLIGDPQRAMDAVMWLEPYRNHARTAGRVQYPDEAHMAQRAYHDISQIFPHGDDSEAAEGSAREAVEAYYGARIVHDQDLELDSVHYCRWGFQFADATAAASTTLDGVGEQA